MSFAMHKDGDGDKGGEMTDSQEIVKALRARFPYFSHHAKDTAYLDTAASALKLDTAISRLSHYLECEHANIHRGAYRLSARATELYEGARYAVREYFSLPDEYVVVFTAGATDGINLVASGLEGGVVNSGDAIVSTLLEHHSNFVPWQELALRAGAQLSFAGLTDEAEIKRDELLSLISKKKPKIVPITAHSNAFGTIPPLEDVVNESQKVGAKVLLDATQLVVHGELDLNRTPVDYLAFSAHKLYGPTGLGVLIAKREALEALRPVRTGGGMIQRVTKDGTSFADIPARFEAGTPPIGEAVAFGETLLELKKLYKQHDLVGMEKEIFSYALECLQNEDGVKVIGPKEPGENFASIISFEVKDVHPHDFATIADSSDVQVRAGHHCVMPAMSELGVQSTVRMSLGLYSSKGDVDKLLYAIQESQRVFQ